MKKKYLVSALVALCLLGILFVANNLTHKESALVLVPYHSDHFEGIRSLFLQNWSWLVHDCTPEEYELDKTIELERVSSIDQTKVKTLVAMKENHLVGFVKYYTLEPKVGRIVFLVTDKNHRRQGIAQTLLRQAMKDLINTGHEMIYLLTRTDNLRSQNLYKNLGFEEISLPDDREDEEDHPNTKTAHFIYRLKKK